MDSTLALLVCAKAFEINKFDTKGIHAITMPGFGTTHRTKNNAQILMDILQVDSKEISIVPSVNQHFIDISQDPNKHDITYENSQARERTQILMDLANKTNGLVVGTGDLSELALGWCTYNCMPDGVKVGSICFSPRGDWRMPSDASRNLWLKQVNELNEQD